VKFLIYICRKLLKPNLTILKSNLKNYRMMKLNLKLITLPLAASVLLLSSCKKDEVVPTPTPTTVSNTPEQDKAALQQMGIDLVKDMEASKNMDGVHVIESLSNCTSQADPFDGLISFSPILVLNAIGSESLKTIEKSLKGSDGQTFFSSYEDVKGTYTWSNGEWIKTTANNVVLVFPSIKDGSNNDATLTISATEYTGILMDAEMEGNTPSSISMILAVAGKGNLMNFSFSSQFNSNGEPSKISSSITMAPYAFNFDFNNTGSKLSKSFSFSKSSANLATIYLEANGTFSKSSIESFIDSEDINDLKNIVTNVSGYIQVKDVKLTGSANVADGITFINSNGGQEDIDENDFIALMNNNANFNLKYASSGQLIANTEWYLTTNTYTNYEWNDNTQQWDEVDYQEQSPNIRLVFSDGSKSDLETYFGSGFDTFINDFEAFFNDLDDAYNL